MKIVCAVHRYFPANSGSEVYARGVCEFLVGRGHEVTAVCTDRLLEKQRYRPLVEDRAGVRITRVSSRGPRRLIAEYIRHPFRAVSGSDRHGLMEPITYLMGDRIKAERPDLILALPISRPSVVAAAQCVEELDVPGVVVPFYHVSLDSFLKDEGRWLDVLRAFTRVLATTRAEEEFLVQKGIPAERIQRPGMWVGSLPKVDPEEVKKWRESRRLKGRFLVVTAAVGDFEQKGIFTLAEVASRLPDVEFLVLGGTNKSRHRFREAARPGPNVTLAGFVTEREKSLALHAADLFAMPSQVESFGIVYVEANASGAPALAADSPVMREVLGEAGLFVPFGDVDAVVKEIRQLAAEPDRRRLLAGLAEQNARRFAPERALGRIAETLEGVRRVPGRRPARSS